MAGVARRRPNQNSRQDCVRSSLIGPGQALLRSARRGLAGCMPSYAVIGGYRRPPATVAATHCARAGDMLLRVPEQGCGWAWL